ncbi:Sodium-coupled monocarboxylate transporter 1 [Halotydeus destructor]|nr:Sodium-coupled monocarboxylate transporter 1 [Halotydeus destructor]
MDLNPLARLTFWTISIGETLKWISTYGFNQAMVQRYLAVPSLKQAQRTVWVVLPFKVLILTLTCGGGLIAYAKYHDCDPIVTKQVKAADQIYPLFVMQSLSFIPGFTGLFVAGVFSGSLSTISSGVNSLAAVTLEDFVKTFWTKKLSDKREAFITKALAVFYGVASLGFVFIAKDMGNILPAVMKVGGLLSPPIGALFMLGMFFPQANSKGAFVGTVCGLAVNLWIGIGSILYKPYYAKKPISVEGCIDLFESATGSTYNETTFVNYYSSPAKMALDEEVLDVYKLSFMYYAVTGTLIPIIVGLIVSKLTNSKEDLEVDIRLFSPPIRKFITASRETQPKNVKLVHVLSNNNLKGNTVAEAET